MANERGRIRSILQKRENSITASEIHKALRSAVDYDLVIDILDDFVALNLVIKTRRNNVSYYKIKPKPEKKGKKDLCINCKKRLTGVDDEMCDQCVTEISSRIQKVKYEQHS